MKRLLILGFIIILGFSIRSFKLTSSPAGLYIDEASIGYNAFSILKTGRDEHGHLWPLFFEAFGEYKLPVYIYSAILTEYVLGPIDVAVRLPAVLYGTATILFLYYFLEELLKTYSNSRLKELPLMAALLLAVSPWHFQFTHAGFEASSGIFFLVLGLYFFFRGANKKSFLSLCGSFLSLGVCLYAYNSARIVVPVLILALLVLYRRSFRWQQWGSVLLLTWVFLLPFIRFAISPAGLVRAQQVSIFYQTQGNKLQEFLVNYWKNISPITLFVEGEPTIAHTTSHRMSLLYLFEAPFFIFGLVLLIAHRKKEFIFMLIFLLVGFIPPAITTLNPHALRASLVIPATIFVSALGISWFSEWLNGQKSKILFWSIFILILSLSSYRFLEIYHTQYTVDAGWDWQVGIKNAASDLKELNPKLVYYFQEAGAARISYLWYLKYDPIRYQMTENKYQFDNIVFNVQSLYQINKKPGLFVTSQVFPKLTNSATIYYPNGSTALYIYSL